MPTPLALAHVRSFGSGRANDPHTEPSRKGCATGEAIGVILEVVAVEALGASEFPPWFASAH